MHMYEVDYVLKLLLPLLLSRLRHESSVLKAFCVDDAVIVATGFDPLHTKNLSLQVSVKVVEPMTAYSTISLVELHVEFYVACGG